jgi:glyoxylase-like metal-dependent hydrolase (beta-lactamase superfamily II)/rhodanese-related sulfurtransferase
MPNQGLISTLSTDELVPLLDLEQPPFLLDVRDRDEVADWQIPGVYNIPVLELAGRLDEVPDGTTPVVICAKGARAQQAAEILSEHDIASRVLVGGMGAWASTYDTVSGDFGGATVVQLRRRGKGCLSYVIGAGENCVVIDPTLDVERYTQVASQHGWRITHVLDTHLHADHLSGARDLVKSTHAALLLSPADPFHFEFEPLTDGRVIPLTDGVDLTVSAVSVPGHTEGSTMYRLGDAAIFTGDTMFLDSVGRPDLAEQAEAFAHSLYRSLHERIMPLPDDVMVFPAHYGTGAEVHTREFLSRPLGELRKTLAALTLGETEFVAWALANVKDRPPNFQQIVRINAGNESLSDEAAEMELGPNRCAIG